MTDTDLERRLRGALSARADAVTRQDLRAWAAPRSAPARWWLPLAAGVAAAVVSIAAFLLFRPVGREPIPPAAPPSPSSPSPARLVETSPLGTTRPTARTSPTAVPGAGAGVSPPVPSRSSSTARATPTAPESRRSAASTPG